MSDSETTNNIKYQNSNGENLLEEKKMTTDTDYCFNLIANPSKIQNTNIVSSDESEMFNDYDTQTDKSSQKSQKSLKSLKSNNSEKIQASDSKIIYDEVILPKQKSNFQPMSEQKKTYEDKNVSFMNMNFEEMNKPITPPVIQQLTPQEIRMKKIELLRKLCEIKSKGYQLSKEYDFNSSLEEMEYEYELLRSFADKRNGVKIFKNGLLQFVSVVEFLNDKYDPFDFQLSGWSEHLTIEIDSWEDILEELYEKYKGKGRKMAPEIKLLYLIGASASAFHFSKSYASKLPGLDSILASNPGLLSKIINTKSEPSKFMTPQELNIERQKEELHKKEQENKQIIEQQNYIKDLQTQMLQQQNMLKSITSELNTARENNKFKDNTNVYSEFQKKLETHEITRKDNINSMPPIIQTSDEVKNILNRIHTLSGTINNNQDTQDELSSNNDRLISETTLSENPKKKYQRKTKKASIVIT
jgi:hypothetical protein